jgi:citrate lyase alpha subunit
MTQDEINAVKKAAEKMRRQESAQDEIIEMARKAGLYQDINVSFHQALRNFYDLATERTWVGLTDDEIEVLFQTAAGADEEVHIRFARAIESKLKELNT